MVSFVIVVDLRPRNIINKRHEGYATKPASSSTRMSSAEFHSGTTVSTSPTESIGARARADGQCRSRRPVHISIKAHKALRAVQEGASDCRGPFQLVGEYRAARLVPRNADGVRMARCDLPAPRLAGGATLNTTRVILGNRHQVLRLRVHSWENVGKTSTVKTCRLAFDVSRGAVTVLDSESQWGRRSFIGSVEDCSHDVAMRLVSMHAVPDTAEDACPTGAPLATLWRDSFLESGGNPKSLLRLGSPRAPRAVPGPELTRMPYLLKNVTVCSCQPTHHEFAPST
ncbi:hypothetical protein C8Q76DRAFT_257612 [Earliella scabrosa]|nr:hypothetical protein C8Q76DRAFT_257612 [Earliella scabrosa]